MSPADRETVANIIVNQHFAVLEARLKSVVELEKNWNSEHLRLERYILIGHM